MSPTDKNIQAHIIKNLEPLPSSWDRSSLENSVSILDPLPETVSAYIEAVRSDILKEHLVINAKTDLKFTYTAMHGVGYDYITQVFDAINLKVVPVEEQKNPDPEFSTVK